jgi:hypothetical protein
VFLGLLRLDSGFFAKTGIKFCGEENPGFSAVLLKKTGCFCASLNILASILQLIQAWLLYPFM